MTSGWGIDRPVANFASAFASASVAGSDSDPSVLADVLALLLAASAESAPAVAVSEIAFAGSVAAAQLWVAAVAVPLPSFEPALRGSWADRLAFGVSALVAADGS